MLTLHLRKETRNGRRGVAYYRDKAATREACFNTWPSRPDYRNRYVMLNCYPWRINWLVEMENQKCAT